LGDAATWSSKDSGGKITIATPFRRARVKKARGKTSVLKEDLPVGRSAEGESGKAEGERKGLARSKKWVTFGTGTVTSLLTLRSGVFFRGYGFTLKGKGGEWRR